MELARLAGKPPSSLHIPGACWGGRGRCHPGSTVLPPAETTIGVIIWWALLIGIATSTLLLVDRLARRALPLAILMQMTMLFPDKAPTRVKMVRMTGSVMRLEERLEAAKAAGDDDVAGNAEQRLGVGRALSAHDRLTRGHAERVRVFVDLIAEELDLDVDDRDRLRWASIAAFDASSAQGGTVSCDAVCVYTPPAAFSGTDTFSYTVADRPDRYCHRHHYRQLTHPPVCASSRPSRSRHFWAPRRVG